MNYLFVILLLIVFLVILLFFKEKLNMNIGAMIIGVCFVVFGIGFLFSVDSFVKFFGLLIILFGILILFNEKEDKIEKVKIYKNK